MTSTFEQNTAQAQNTPIPPTPDSGGPRRVLVLGGGVAGLTAAHELHRLLGKRAEILVISDQGQFMLGLALLGIPFGRRTAKVGFPIAPSLARHGITFLQASVERIDPLQREVLAGGQHIPYDYLLIATGPAADTVAIPGVGGEFHASQSIHTEQAAIDTREAVKRFLDKPGPAVVGLAPGASYLSASYEFVLWLDYALRKRGQRDKATLTFVTPEAHLGHLGTDTPKAERLLQQRFAERKIQMITGHDIVRVDRDTVYLRGGRTLPSIFTLVTPSFHGVPDVWKSLDLADTHGYVPVDAQFRHKIYPEIYAVGVAAQVDVPNPPDGGLPKTGYLASVAARVAARNLAGAITSSSPGGRQFPRLLDLRIIDGGDTGILLLSGKLIRRFRLALPLSGRTAHRMKGVLARYVLWKLRTGRTYLP